MILGGVRMLPVGREVPPFVCMVLSALRSPPKLERTSAELRELNETLAAIRLRASLDDPYEDWERSVHQDAYVRHPCLHARTMLTI